MAGSSREEITRELLSGKTAYELSKVYPRATVYRINNELVTSGQIGAGGGSGIASGGPLDDTEDGPNFTPKPQPLEVPNNPPPQQTMQRQRVAQSQRTTHATSASGMAGVSVVEVADSLMPGAKTLPADALSAVRGILGMLMRPKVLSMPTPELLYPAMVISIEEWGWPPMKPNDFIDTVLDRFLRAADIEFNTYIKRGQLEELIKYAEKGGYKAPGSSHMISNLGVNNQSAPADDAASDVITNKEEIDGSEQGRSRPAGAESTVGGEQGGQSDVHSGPDTSGEGGTSGPPI